MLQRVHYVGRSIVPLETATMLLWWLIGGIISGTDVDGHPWYTISYHTVMTSLLQVCTITTIIWSLHRDLLERAQRTYGNNNGNDKTFIFRHSWP